jgi:hypothetical protein
MDWIDLAQDRDLWALVNAVMNLGVHVGNFLTAENRLASEEGVSK